MLADSLRVKLDNDESLSEIIFGLGGIQAPETKNIGLRFFVANKADLVEYEVISELSNIESAASLLDEKMKRMIDFMFIAIDKNDRSNKEKMLYHLNNVINSEESLVELYTNLAENKR